MSARREKAVEKILMAASFAFFFIIACHKLTNASLWFDEAVEFWYSKVWHGELPFPASRAVGTVNMYERIISTFQPPLYNFLAFFWLKVSTSMWWFRFFGVAVGFAGIVGLYKTVRKLGNAYLAAASVFFASCVYQLVYYWQECAEYCLVAALLFWTLYFFVSFIEEPSLKNCILLTVFSVLPVYSQYGAVFPVAAMLVIAYIAVLVNKDKSAKIYTTLSYLIAFAVAALPLMFLFLFKQMEAQKTAEIMTLADNVTGRDSGNVFLSFFADIREVVGWAFFTFLDEPLKIQISRIALVLLIMCTAGELIFSKRRAVRLLAVLDIVTWILYWGAVRTGVYSYGIFGERYSLFFIPLWTVSLFAFLCELYDDLRRKIESTRSAKCTAIYSCICTVAGLAILVIFMAANWRLAIRDNWTKEDMRTAVSIWKDEGGAGSDTIVYYAGSGAFAYFLRRNGYESEEGLNLHYMPWLRDKTIAEYTDYLNSLYGDSWPEEVYIAATHTRKDLNKLAKAFTRNGYEREDLCTENCTLMRMTRKK